MIDGILDKSVLGFTRLGPKLRELPEVTERLDGKRVLITGGTGGIGAGTARALAALGAHVVIVGRSQSKGEQVVESIRKEGGSAQLHLKDLQHLSSVKELAEAIGKEPLHILINNAGVLLSKRDKTEEGFEKSFAINALGQHLLTRLLTDHLVSSCVGFPARVINISSGGMYTQKLRSEDIQLEKESFRGDVFYAHTKRIQVIATEIFAQKYNSESIVFHSMHPGWVDTDGVRTSMPRFHKLLKHALRSVAQGADTIVWLSAAQQPLNSNGKFWHDRQVRPTHRSKKTRENEQERTRMWDQLEQWCGPHFS